MKKLSSALAVLACALFAAGAFAQPAMAQDKKAPEKAAEKKAEKAPEKAADKAPIRAQKILVDNDRIRVSESVFKPGETNPTVKRGYRVTRVLKGNTTVERTINGKKETIEYKEGAVIVAPAGMSTTKNVGKQEVTIYTVTLKPE